MIAAIIVTIMAIVSIVVITISMVITAVMIITGNSVVPMIANAVMTLVAADRQARGNSQGDYDGKANRLFHVRLQIGPRQSEAILTKSLNYREMPEQL